MIKLDKDNTKEIIQMSLALATALFARLTLGIFGESMVKQFKFFVAEQRNRLQQRNG